MTAARRRFDPGRLVARVLALLLASVALVPSLLALLLRLPAVEAFLAREAARLLHAQLGVTASFEVGVTLWPPSVELRHLVVPANDGGEPVLTARRVSAKPGLLALLSGHPEAGVIEIDDPAARLVLRDGRLANLDYRLPTRSAPRSAPSRRAPFTSLSLSNARIELRQGNDLLVRSGPLDVDVDAERGPRFEVSLRAGESRVVRRRARRDLAPAEDDDLLCRLDLRLSYEAARLVVHRLSALGVADRDPAAGTFARCKDAARSADSVLVRLSDVRVGLLEPARPSVDGHVVVRLPAHLGSRFAPVPLDGWVAFSGDVGWDGVARLPEVAGKLQGEGIVLDGAYRLARRLEAEVRVRQDSIVVPRFRATIADGEVVATDTVVRPFDPGLPIMTERVEVRSITFPGLMRDVDVTPNTIVQWDIDAKVTRFGGTLDPPRLDGDIVSSTRNFAVFDRAWHAPGRRRMIGVPEATVRGRIGVRENSFDLYEIRTEFGKSVMNVGLVSIGFDNRIALSVRSSVLELGDVSPIAALSMAGRSELSVEMHGKANDPLLTGELSVSGLTLAGFPVGDIEHARVRFVPLKVDFLEVKGRKNRSSFRSPIARLDFDGPAAVAVDARVESDAMDLRDFFHMWHFDKDPRFDPILGVGKVAATVRYELGGPGDPCRDGHLRVRGSSDFAKLELFEERYDGGEADFDFRWFDARAGHRGMEVAVNSFRLRKGEGTVLGAATIGAGGVLRARAVASNVPLSRLDALGTLGALADGRVSAVATVGGTIDEMEAEVDVAVTPVRLGARELPASALHVSLVPVRGPPVVAGPGLCAQPASPPFDRTEYDRDAVQGTFLTKGQLFGGQVQLAGLAVTRQRKKRVTGEVALRDLDLGALAELVPGLSSAERPLTGSVGARLQLEDLPVDRWWEGNLYARLTRLEASRGAAEVALLPGSKTMTLSRGSVTIPGLSLATRTRSGARTVFDVSGTLDDLMGARRLEAEVALRPTSLAALVGLSPSVERAEGRVLGSVRARGPLAALDYTGRFQVEGGEIAFRGGDAPLRDIDLTLAIGGGELRIERGFARMGEGTIALSGGVPLRGLELGAAQVGIRVRDLTFPARRGLSGRVDADLLATWSPSGDARALPRITGTVDLDDLAYTRPIVLSADLGALARRGKRTDVERWDPAGDLVAFDVVLRARQPLRVDTNLVEAEIEVAPEGLVLGGTNQRFGLRGDLALRPGGRLRLRQTEFEIQEGRVRFSDPERIAPEVDVTAVTEYQRYSDLSGDSSAASGAASTSATSAVGGRWRILLRAHGDAENLKVDLRSEPALAQDDIFLLLTVGVTRAELDQSQSSSVGESVALEALGTLSGADRAVTAVIPVIDEFRFGSAYSSRTGRTEPTVTVGKRVTRRVRVTATTGVGEAREVRSNVEVRLGRALSLEGSYDNVNDLSGSFGNLGGGVRWRLEFE